MCKERADVVIGSGIGGAAAAFSAGAEDLVRKAMSFLISQ
jgi:thioredoxin reductase